MHLSTRFLPLLLVVFYRAATAFEIYQLTSISTSCSESEVECLSCTSMFSTHTIPSMTDSAPVVATTDSTTLSSLSQSCIGYGCQETTTISTTSSTVISISHVTATAEPTTVSVTLEPQAHTNTTSVPPVTTTCVLAQTSTEHSVSRVYTTKVLSSSTLIGAGSTMGGLTSHSGQPSSATSTHGSTGTVSVPSPSPYKGSASSLRLASSFVPISLFLCILSRF